MSIIELNMLIDNVPKMCNLFLYGFIFMATYTWITSKKLDTYIYVLWGLFINFIIVNFYKVIHLFVFHSYTVPESFKTLVYSLTAIVIPFVIYYIINTNMVRNALSKYIKKTLSDNIFDDLVDHKKKNIIRAYLKDSDIYYEGTLALREEKGSDSYISLINYRVYNGETSEILLDTTSDEYRTSVILNLKDLVSVEIYYSVGSDTWEWLTKLHVKNTVFPY